MACWTLRIAEYAIQPACGPDRWRSARCAGSADHDQRLRARPISRAALRRLACHEPRRRVRRNRGGRSRRFAESGFAGRAPVLLYTHFDYWLGFGLTFPADLANMDFNSGSKTNVPNPPKSFVFFTPAVNLQWGETGIGSISRFSSMRSSPEEGQRRGITATIPTMHIQSAHGFLHNQFVAGVGVRYITMTVNSPDEEGFPFRSSGPGFEFGAVYKPENVPLRLGVAYRTPIVTQASYSDNLLPNANGDLIIQNSDGANIYLPKAVASPWDFNFGIATQIGRRPINPPWREDEEQIEQQTLERRLRGLARERARDKALRSARTNAEYEAIQRKFEKRRRRTTGSSSSRP